MGSGAPLSRARLSSLDYELLFSKDTYKSLMKQIRRLCYMSSGYLGKKKALFYPLSPPKTRCKSWESYICVSAFQCELKKEGNKGGKRRKAKKISAELTREKCGGAGRCVGSVVSAK